MSTALRSVWLLDVLQSTPSEPSRRASGTHARLHRLATKPGEKRGLGPAEDASGQQTAIEAEPARTHEKGAMIRTFANNAG